MEHIWKLSNILTGNPFNLMYSPVTVKFRYTYELYYVLHSIYQYIGVKLHCSYFTWRLGAARSINNKRMFTSPLLVVILYICRKYFLNPWTTGSMGPMWSSPANWEPGGGNEQDLGIMMKIFAIYRQVILYFNIASSNLSLNPAKRCKMSKSTDKK